VDQAELSRRADEILGQLTTDEKIALLHQWSPGVPRLGIAPFRTGTEALHGAAWLGPATVFPQAVGLGATWDPDLLTAVGAAVGAEVRALHRRDPAVSLNVWAPVVNLLRDPRWGRNEEGYAEDPLLTARLATAYCAGLRGDHPVFWQTAPLLKHFLAHNNETARDTTSALVRARLLHEYELPPFRGPVQAGVAVGVMPAYSLVNGRPNHVSPLLGEQLRTWADADELVVCSDAYAPSNLVETEHYFPGHAESHAAALRAGVDSFTDQDADPSRTVARLTDALRRGLISQADVDRAARRLLLLRLRLGEFHPDLDPYRAGPATIDPAGHQDLARRAARQSIVLLKNEAGVLPLDPAGPRLAVVGPFADTLRTDWYSGTLPYQVTVAAGLREALAGAGAPGGVGEAVRAAGLREALAGAGAPGGTGEPVRAAGPPEALPGAGAPGGVGEARARAAVTVADGADWVRLAAATPGAPDLGEFDVQHWGPGLPAADGLAAADDVITLRSVTTGRYLTVRDDDSLTAGADRPNGWVVRETFALEPVGDGPDVVLRAVATGRYLAADGTSRELRASAPDAASAQPFRWDVLRDGTAEAARAAAEAGRCVLVVGNDPLINGRENQDRATLALPPAQDRLIRAVHAACPRLVLVVMSSYPYALGWAADHVPAIVWTSHGGQETGRALADVLTGAHEPAGRLAQTWYAGDEDLPGLLDYDIIKTRRTYLYFDGCPLYPFGHGLSYTTFSYSRLRLAPRDVAPGGTVTVSVEVTNTGARAGTEVVQCYTGPVAPRRPQPHGVLAGFTRLSLAPGETRTAEIEVPGSALAYWDVAAHRMTVDPGDYLVKVGSSSAAIQQSGWLRVRGPVPPPRPAGGGWIAAADFDDYAGIVLVDETRERGDAVTPAGPAPGWIQFRDTDLAAGPLSVTVRVAREEPAPATVAVHAGPPGHGDPAAGELLGTLTVPSTGSRYTWTEVGTGLRDLAGPASTDLYLVLDGPVRLAAFRVHR
jgi:beta-glucosidase